MFDGCTGAKRLWYWRFISDLTSSSMYSIQLVRYDHRSGDDTACTCPLSRHPGLQPQETSASSFLPYLLNESATYFPRSFLPLVSLMATDTDWYVPVLIATSTTTVFPSRLTRVASCSYASGVVRRICRATRLGVLGIPSSGISGSCGAHQHRLNSKLCTNVLTIIHDHFMRIVVCGGYSARLGNPHNREAREDGSAVSSFQPSERSRDRYPFPCS